LLNFEKFRKGGKSLKVKGEGGKKKFVQKTLGLVAWGESSAERVVERKGKAGKKKNMLKSKVGEHSDLLWNHTEKRNSSKRREFGSGSFDRNQERGCGKGLLKA